MKRQGTRRAALVMTALLLASAAFWSAALRQAPVPGKIRPAGPDVPSFGGRTGNLATI